MLYAYIYIFVRNLPTSVYECSVKVPAGVFRVSTIHVHATIDSSLEETKCEMGEIVNSKVDIWLKCPSKSPCICTGACIRSACCCAFYL